MLAERAADTPVFLDELILLATTVIAYHERRVSDVKVRKGLTDKLQRCAQDRRRHSLFVAEPRCLDSIVETQIQYAAFTISKTKDAHKHIRDRMRRADEHTRNVYNEYVKTVVLDDNPKNFYRTFVDFLLAVGQAVTSFYNLARLSFIDCVDDDLAVSKDKLELVRDALNKVREQPSHARKDVLVDTYQDATEVRVAKRGCTPEGACAHAPATVFRRPR